MRPYRIIPAASALLTLAFAQFSQAQATTHYVGDLRWENDCEVVMSEDSIQIWDSAVTLHEVFTEAEIQEISKRSSRVLLLRREQNDRRNISIHFDSKGEITRVRYGTNEGFGYFVPMVTCRNLRKH